MVDTPKVYSTGQKSSSMLKPHGRLLGAVLKPHGRLSVVPGLSLLVGYHFAMLKPHGRLCNSVIYPTVGWLNVFATLCF